MGQSARARCGTWVTKEESPVERGHGLQVPEGESRCQGH